MKQILFIAISIVFIVGMMFFSYTFAQLGGFEPQKELTKKQLLKLSEIQAKSYFEFELKLGERFFGDEKTIGKIQKITLERFNEDPVLVYHNERTLKTSTKDVILLAVAQRICEEDMILRPYFSPNSGMGCGGPYINGTLKIQTEKRMITILITRLGFRLGNEDEGPLRQCIFYSWGLTKVVDDMIDEATKGRQHLSRELFVALSGESVIEQNKQVYCELRHDYESEKNIEGLLEELEKLSKKLEEKEKDDNL